MSRVSGLKPKGSQARTNGTTAKGRSNAAETAFPGPGPSSNMTQPASESTALTPTMQGPMLLDQLESPKPSTPRFVFALTVLSAIGGFLFGYDTGVISGAMILLREEFVLNSLWQELIVSMTIAAAAVFAIIGGFLNDRLGRKPVIITASVIFTAGSLCLGLAGDRTSLLVGRIIVGAGIGLTSMTIPMYIAEVAPTAIRGRLVSTNVVMIACGQFVANVIDGMFSFYGNGWRYMLGLGGIPSLIQFISFLFMPESPRWLIINGQEQKARLVLQRVRGAADIDDEYEAIKTSCQEAEKEQAARSHTPIIWQMLRTPSVRRALLIGCSLQMFQQLAGINTVMYYSATIIKMSGVKSETVAIWLSAVTAAVNFVFTFLGVYLVEKIGRRPLTLGSLLGAVISLAWLAIGFQLSALNSPPVTNHEAVNTNSRCNMYQTCNHCMMDLYCGYCYVDTDLGPANASCLPSDYNDPIQATVGRCNITRPQNQLTWAYDFCPTPFAWMAMTGLVMYLVFFAPGMGPMPWTINSEIYPLWARSTGSAVATFTNWAFNLLISMTFLSLTEAITRYGTFWLYAGLTMIGLVFFAFVLPETKGKTLEEVEGLFAQPWCSREGGPPLPYTDNNSIQYVHIQGLNRDGHESELESPE